MDVLTKYTKKRKSYQIIKDVSLMYVNRDKCLKLGPLHLGQFLSRNLNQWVQQIQELLVRRGHNFFVRSRILKRFFGISGPDHLNA